MHISLLEIAGIFQSTKNLSAEELYIPVPIIRHAIPFTAKVGLRCDQSKTRSYNLDREQYNLLS
jgi:hypothetical protein